MFFTPPLKQRPKEINMKKTLVATGLVIATIMPILAGQFGPTIPELDIGISTESAQRIEQQAFTLRPIRTNPTPNMPALSINNLTSTSPSGADHSYDASEPVLDDIPALSITESDTRENLRTSQISPKSGQNRFQTKRTNLKELRINCLGLLRTPTMPLQPSARENTRVTIKPKKPKKRNQHRPLSEKLPHVAEETSPSLLTLPTGLLDTDKEYAESLDKLSEIDERIRKNTQEVTDRIVMLTSKIRQARLIQRSSLIPVFIDNILIFVKNLHKENLSKDQKKLLKKLSYEIGFGKKHQSGKLLTKKGQTDQWILPQKRNNLAHFHGSNELVKKIEDIQAIIKILTSSQQTNRYLKVRKK